jgi:hypothetical protein
MIVVLASRLDPEARALVAAWSHADAALLSAEDISTVGWDFDPSDPAGGTAVVEGRRVRIAQLRGVLTRRPAVIAEELARIAPSDRTYVAAEANAFLVAWLSALPCRVVNEPTPTSLCGPAWDRWRWQAAAARAGLPWAQEAPDEPREQVVVCGQRVFFARSAPAAACARRLAQHARVTLLGVQMQRACVSGASIAPPLSDPELRVALCSYLLEGS